MQISTQQSQPPREYYKFHFIESSCVTCERERNSSHAIGKTGAIRCSKERTVLSVGHLRNRPGSGTEWLAKQNFGLWYSFIIDIDSDNYLFDDILGGGEFFKIVLSVFDKDDPFPNVKSALTKKFKEPGVYHYSGSEDKWELCQRQEAVDKSEVSRPSLTKVHHCYELKTLQYHPRHDEPK